MVAEAILCGTLVLAVTKNFLLVDAVFLPGEGSSAVARLAQSIHVVSSAGSPVASPRQESRQPASGVNSPKRTLHRRLLCMHVTSSLTQVAGALKYILPASDTSCVVTHRFMQSQLLLYDASLVLFLLAKVHVTNGGRALACWEKGIVWWSRFYGWIFLPLCALFLGATFPGTADPEGEFCFNGLTSEEVADGLESPTLSPPTAEENANNYAVVNTLLMVQFVILLGLFVKPLLAGVQGTQSGGALYRKIVWRNIICTVCIVIFYAITTIIVYLQLLHETLENNKTAQFRDAMLGINTFVTLCLTEITLPLGFSSCLTTCRKTFDQGNSTKNETGGSSARPVASTGATLNNTKVIPTEAQAP